jgi:hypothetical protein
MAFIEIVVIRAIESIGWKDFVEGRTLVSDCCQRKGWDEVEDNAKSTRRSVPE